MAAVMVTVGEDTVETTKVVATTRAMVGTTVTSTIRTVVEVEAIKVTIGETIILAGMVATVAMTAMVAVTTRRGMGMMAVATSEATTVRIVTIMTIAAGMTIAIGMVVVVDSGHAMAWIVVVVEWMPMVVPEMEERITTARVLVVAIEGTRGTTTGWVTKESNKGSQ